MLHLFGGATETRRLPGASQFPWIPTLFWAFAVLMITGAVLLGIALTTDWLSGRSAPVAQPGQEVQIGPASEVNPPAQTEPEVAIPVAPVVVDYRVVWTEVKGFDPSTIPVGGGIYDANYSWSSTKGAYADAILPHLKEVGVAVAATRDQDIVLASLDADRYGPYLLLSVDGEKSWCRLNLIPITWEGQATNGVTPEEVRVMAQGEEIHLYGRYALGAGSSHLYWWETVVTKSKLPCS